MKWGLTGIGNNNGDWLGRLEKTRLAPYPYAVKFMWQFLISSDLPITPEYDLLRDQYRNFNRRMEQALRTGASRFAPMNSPKLFIVFRESDRFVNGRSTVGFDSSLNTYGVDSPADAGVMGYEHDGFEALRHRILEELDRVDEFALISGKVSPAKYIREVVETLSR